MVVKSIFEKLIKAQILLPTFEDNMKLLQFWIDQQDKWFYFETDIVQSSSYGEEEVPAQMYQLTPVNAYRNHTIVYIQSRIIGKIHNVIFNPPSMMLDNTIVITAEINFDRNKHTIISRQERMKYGLVFSQITYFEPIEDHELFLEKDGRVN